MEHHHDHIFSAKSTKIFFVLFICKFRASYLYSSSLILFTRFNTLEIRYQDRADFNRLRGEYECKSNGEKRGELNTGTRKIFPCKFFK